MSTGADTIALLFKFNSSRRNAASSSERSSRSASSKWISEAKATASGELSCCIFQLLDIIQREKFAMEMRLFRTADIFSLMACS